jgi:dihydropyrimidinase
VGSDADIIVVDPDARRTMSVEHNHMDVDYTCYEGKEIEGSIDVVIAKGKVLIQDGQYLGSPGDGEYLPRATSQYLI